MGMFGRLGVGLCQGVGCGGGGSAREQGARPLGMLR